MRVAQSRRIVNFISLLGVCVTVSVIIYLVSMGAFRDINVFQRLVGHSLIMAPIIFILLQIIQVVIPIIPGGISTAAGVLIFGPVAGFIYNYIGIALGSVIIFLLGRRFGKPLVLSLISDKTYNKYMHWLENQERFDKLFALAIFLPIAPDDALCLMAGLTNISLKKFIWIIVLAKPASIAAYSFALVYGLEMVAKIFG
ncbi:TVP38/TMEM64 family protein [Vagococcus acidifermentans]|uniref:TVP38/TMEM64 family membrane protein n=1 Tax=Vagococcus acidifermentans TaxID=564710 RepID=A0A430AQL4_9ENTE|nr:VTT domain-containing protein [Vagococcus acidifermentans]RSU10273.1 hypothetical protein CBF27_11040 [Vagococcus acidifermentans]